MEEIIFKLRRIFLGNKQLSIYNESLNDNMSVSECYQLIDKILIDFKDLLNKPDRPKYIGELQLLRNRYNEDNPYPQSQI